MSGSTYPVSLVVSGRRCLVVGGGRVAARKAEGLLEHGAMVKVVAKEVDPMLRSLPLEWEQRAYKRGEVEGYWLAVAATGDPAVNRAVYEDGERARVWVNAADDPGSCSFMLPAVARQGPVSVSVSTSGLSPALSSWLAGQIRQWLGPEWREAAEMLAAARSGMKLSGHSTEKADWRRALDSGMLEMLQVGRRELAEELLRRCLSLS